MDKTYGLKVTVAIGVVISGFQENLTTDYALNVRIVIGISRKLKQVINNEKFLEFAGR